MAALVKTVQANQPRLWLGKAMGEHQARKPDICALTPPPPSPLHLMFSHRRGYRSVGRGGSSYLMYLRQGWVLTASAPQSLGIVLASILFDPLTASRPLHETLYYMRCLPSYPARPGTWLPRIATTSVGTQGSVPVPRGTTSSLDRRNELGAADLHTV